MNNTVNLVKGYIDGILNPSIYKQLINKSFGKIILYLLPLAIVFAIAFITNINNNVLRPGFHNVFNTIEEQEYIEIYDGKAIFNPDLTMPHIRTFEIDGREEFTIIYDLGPNITKLQENYSNYILMSENTLYIDNDGHVVESKYSELDNFMTHYLLGNPIYLNPETLANMSIKIMSLFFLLYIPPFFVLPIPLLMLLGIIVGSAIIILAYRLLNQNQESNIYTNSELFKLSLLTSTPAIYLQIIILLLLSLDAISLLLIVASWVLHYMYLKKSLISSPTIIEE